MGAGPEGTGLRPRRAAKGTRNQEDWAVGPHQGRVGTRRPRARSPRPRASWLRMSRDPRPHPPQPGPAPRRPASAKIAGQRGLAATARAAHVAAGSGLGPSAPAHHRPPTTQAQPYLGGRHGGAAAVAAARLARSLLVPGPLGGDSELSLRVWRRRLPPARSFLRPATRTLTPDPGGGKRAAIQNQCSFIGSGDGHCHCPARPVLPAKTPAAHARPSRQPRERVLPTALARTSAPRPRVVLGLK